MSAPLPELPIDFLGLIKNMILNLSPAVRFCVGGCIAFLVIQKAIDWIKGDPAWVSEVGASDAPSSIQKLDERIEHLEEKAQSAKSSRARRNYQYRVDRLTAYRHSRASIIYTRRKNGSRRRRRRRRF